MRRVKSLNRIEKRALAALLLLCLLPVGIAWLSERRRATRSRPKLIHVSQKTLAKYKNSVPLGGIGYVRLGDQGWGGGPEGSWEVCAPGQTGFQSYGTFSRSLSIVNRRTGQNARSYFVLVSFLCPD